MKIKMLHKRSVVPYITIDPTSPLAKMPGRIKVLQNCEVVYNSSKELVLAQSYAWPDGFGRSMRAIVLGLKYKVAKRVNGDATDFFYDMFNFPQANAGFKRAVKLARQQNK